MKGNEKKTVVHPYGTVLVGISWRSEAGSGPKFRYFAVGVSEETRRTGEYWFNVYKEEGKYKDISRAFRYERILAVHLIDSYDELPEQNPWLKQNQGCKA